MDSVNQRCSLAKRAVFGRKRVCVPRAFAKRAVQIAIGDQLRMRSAQRRIVDDDAVVHACDRAHDDGLVVTRHRLAAIGHETLLL